MLGDSLDYRDYLKDIYNHRRQFDLKYSIRAFARDLNVPVSTLFGVLQYKKNLTSKQVQHIVDLKIFEESERRHFSFLFEYEVTSSSDRKSQILSEIKILEYISSRKRATAEKTNSLTHWYDIALIELASNENIGLKSDWAASLLNLAPEDVQESLNRLTALGFLNQENDIYKKKNHGYVFEAKAESTILTKIHIEFLKQLIRSMETQSSTERVVGTETFYFSKTQFEEANQIIESCFNQLVSLSKKCKSPDGIYTASLNLFRLNDSPIK